MVNSAYLEIMCKQLNAEAIIFYGMTWKTLLLKGWKIKYFSRDLDKNYCLGRNSKSSIDHFIVIILPHL